MREEDPEIIYLKAIRFDYKERWHGREHRYEDLLEYYRGDEKISLTEGLWSIDLTPLKYFYNLRTLEIWPEESIDLTPLSSCSNLETLDLRRNPPQLETIDLKPLASCPHVRIYLI